MSRTVEDIQALDTLAFHQHPQIQLNMDHSQEHNIGVNHYPVGYPIKSKNHHLMSKIQDSIEGRYKLSHLKEEQEYRTPGRHYNKAGIEDHTA